MHEDKKNLYYLVNTSIKPFQDSGFAFSFDVRRVYKVADPLHPEDVGLNEHYLIMCDKKTIGAPLVQHIRGDGMLGKLDPLNFGRGLAEPDSGTVERKILDYVCSYQLGKTYNKDPMPDSQQIRTSATTLPPQSFPINTYKPLLPQPISNYAAISTFTPISSPSNILPMVRISDGITLKLTSPTIFESRVSVLVKNQNPVPYVVKLVVFNQAMDTEIIGEQIITIDPYADIEVNLSPIEGKNFIAPVFTRGLWKVGDFKKTKDPSGFWIPIPNAKVEVCQSPDGPVLTHIDNPEAIDFCAPLGSLIIAAKDGIVIEAIGQNTEGGADPKYLNKDNRVSIYHSDGSVSTYGHMAYKSVKVKIGQIVKRGDPIGNIGLTGQTSGPHVHFTVGYKNANFDNVNLSPIFMSPRNHVIPISYLSILTMDGIIKEGVKNKTPGSALNPAQTP